jgi:hypothetical protein
MNQEASHPSPPASPASDRENQPVPSRLGERQGLTFLEVSTVLLITLLIALYFVLRYGGLWAENDTVVQANAIRAVADSGRLIPEDERIYFNGYAYQVIAAFVLGVTGLDVVRLQQLVFPFAILLLATPACLLLYEISGSKRCALVGAVLLFTQPEFLFVVLRGSHEKFGRLFLILALYLLFRSFKYRDKLGLFATYIALFYLAVYGLLASNFLIGFSFVAALAFGLAAGALLETFRLRSVKMIGATSRRLFLVVFASFILAFVFAFYTYPPAQQVVLIIDGILGKAQALLAGGESAENVYGSVLSAWVSPAVYVFVNLSNWIILGLSLAIWTWQGYTWVIRKHSPPSRSAWLLWLLYGAFGFQALFSIISDASGYFINLQHRVFPSFALLGVAIVTDTVVKWIFSQPRPRLVKISLALIAFLMAISSLIKATNEVSLVSYWTFYMPAELHAVQWFDSKEENNILWIGDGPRLADALGLIQSGTSSENRYSSQKTPAMPYILLSDWIEKASLQKRTILPSTRGQLAIYDNGSARIYHRRPVTPYQR